jgi:predicted subunit of tRNA(5-methylaminomethyl-2-thiouridylate) methyltransferase
MNLIATDFGVNKKTKMQETQQEITKFHFSKGPLKKESFKNTLEVIRSENTPECK